MARIEEQIAADEALTAAIERTAHAYGVLDDRDVMGGYVIVAETQELTADDEVINSYIQLVRDGSMASTTSVGLLDTASFDMKMSRNG